MRFINDFSRNNKKFHLSIRPKSALQGRWVQKNTIIWCWTHTRNVSYSYYYMTNNTRIYGITKSLFNFLVAVKSDWRRMISQSFITSPRNQETLEIRIRNVILQYCSLMLLFPRFCARKEVRVRVRNDGRCHDDIPCPVVDEAGRLTRTQLPNDIASRTDSDICGDVIFDGVC